LLLGTISADWQPARGVHLWASGATRWTMVCSARR
jgi:hypothetical protein